MATVPKFPGHFSRNSYFSNVGLGKQQPGRYTHNQHRRASDTESFRVQEVANDQMNRAEKTRVRLQEKIDRKNQAGENAQPAQIVEPAQVIQPIVQPAQNFQPAEVIAPIADLVLITIFARLAWNAQ